MLNFIYGMLALLIAWGPPSPHVLEALLPRHLLHVKLPTAQRKELWARWLRYNKHSKLTIDNHFYAYFLKKYVVTNSKGVNLVKYGAVTAEDKQKLIDYVHYLESLKISDYNRNAQEAYWINLYNAETLVIILKNYPLKSILDLSYIPFSKTGPWNWELMKVEHQPLTLNDIENRILRPIWDDPRIHYALNCASYSCPNLQKVPYNQKNLNMLLNKGAVEYINNPRGVYIMRGYLYVSAIYKWYQVDFGDSEEGVIAHLNKYASPQLKKQLQRFAYISGYRYDWSLNDMQHYHTASL